MNKLILTDCDGVLCNWNNSFEEFMGTKGHYVVAGTEHEYNLSERYNITSRQAMLYVKEFNEGPGIEHLEPFADSVHYIAELAKLGFRFTVITSISRHPEAAVRRTNNLKNIFGDVFDEIHCIDQGASKADILLNWGDTGYFWIEDHMRQAEAGHEAGLKTVLIRHPYNEHYSTDLFPTVSFENPWKEIYALVCKEYNLVPSLAL